MQLVSLTQCQKCTLQQFAAASLLYLDRLFFRPWPYIRLFNSKNGLAWNKLLGAIAAAMAA